MGFIVCFLLQKCKEVVAYFSHQLLDSLQKATRLSLDSLKKRIFVSKWVANERFLLQYYQNSYVCVNIIMHLYSHGVHVSLVKEFQTFFSSGRTRRALTLCCSDALVPHYPFILYIFRLYSVHFLLCRKWKVFFYFSPLSLYPFIFIVMYFPWDCFQDVSTIYCPMWMIRT